MADSTVTVQRSDRRHLKFARLLADFDAAIRHGHDDAAERGKDVAYYVRKNAEHIVFTADPPKASRRAD